MSYRPQASPFPVFNATTGQSMAGSLTSLVTIIQKLSLVSYSYSWTGTSPVGTVIVQVSNDYALTPSGAVANAGTWNTMTLTYQGSQVTSIPISGNTGNGFVDIDLTAGYAIRTVYTAGSGTGTLSATFCAKVA